jgi:hypothetical protein
MRTKGTWGLFCNHLENTFADRLMVGQYEIVKAIMAPGFGN